MGKRQGTSSSFLTKYNTMVPWWIAISMARDNWKQSDIQHIKEHFKLAWNMDSVLKLFKIKNHSTTKGNILRINLKAKDSYKDPTISIKDTLGTIGNMEKDFREIINFSTKDNLKMERDQA